MRYCATVELYAYSYQLSCSEVWLIIQFFHFKQDAANVLVVSTEKSAKEDDPGMIFFFR